MENERLGERGEDIALVWQYDLWLIAPIFHDTVVHGFGSPRMLPLPANCSWHLLVANPAPAPRLNRGGQSGYNHSVS